MRYPLRTHFFLFYRLLPFWEHNSRLHWCPWHSNGNKHRVFFQCDFPLFRSVFGERKLKTYLAKLRTYTKTARGQTAENSTGQLVAKSTAECYLETVETKSAAWQDLFTPHLCGDQGYQEFRPRGEVATWGNCQSNWTCFLCDGTFGRRLTAATSRSVTQTSFSWPQESPVPLRFQCTARTGNFPPHNQNNRWKGNTASTEWIVNPRTKRSSWLRRCTVPSAEQAVPEIPLEQPSNSISF